ncbi:MAG: carboxypeptidase-like regulatory domain-containing protein [Polyangiaceae bacterium]
MNILSRLPGSLRSTTVLRGLTAALGAAFLAGALTACDSSPKCTSSCGGNAGTGGNGGTGGSASCTSTKGTIAGTAYLDAGKTMPAANADIQFVLMPADPSGTVLHGTTDAEGKFSVELDPGTWAVGGKEASGCIPTTVPQVTLAACATETVEIVFDTCPG